MTRLFAWVGPFAPFAVFVLAAAESAAFVGVVVPGELAVILGGVAASTGTVSLWAMIPAAVAGAIVGDTIGYRLGHRAGPAFLDRPRMAKISARFDAASKIVADRGWWALVVARFAAVLRAFVPFAAGMARMPYRQFVFGNAIGGLIWGTTFTLVGYVAGANYPRVEKWFRAGGLAVVGLLALIGGIVWTTRWVQRHRDAVAGGLASLGRRRPFSWAISGIRRANRPALTLVLTALGIIAGTWVFGGLAQDVVGAEEFFFFDISSLRYLDVNRIEPLIAASRIVNAFTDPVVLLVVAGAGVILAATLGRRRMALAVVTTLTGQWLIVELTAALVDRVPPLMAPLAARVDYGFPSEHVALTAALACVLAWPWTRPGWKQAVFRFGAGAVVVALTAASRVILLIEYPSDAIAATAIATAWTLVVCLAFDPSREGNSSRSALVDEPG